MKRIISILLVLAMVFVLVGCGGGTTTEGSEVKIVMITDTGGLGDESFNDMAYAGLLQAADEFGVQYSVLESATADAVPHHRKIPVRISGRRKSR